MKANVLKKKVDVEEEMGTLSGAAPEGPSACGRCEALRWVCVRGLCSRGACRVRRAWAARPPTPQRRGAGTVLSALVSSLRGRCRRSAGVKPGGTRGRTEQRPFQLRCHGHPRWPCRYPVSVGWDPTSDLCHLRLAGSDRGLAVTLQVRRRWCGCSSRILPSDSSSERPVMQRAACPSHGGRRSRGRLRRVRSHRNGCGFVGGFFTAGGLMVAVFYAFL